MRIVIETLGEALPAVANVFGVVLALHFWMERRGRGFDTTYVQAAHNLVLCVGSLAMALGAATEAADASQPAAFVKDPSVVGLASLQRSEARVYDGNAEAALKLASVASAA